MKLEDQYYRALTKADVETLWQWTHSANVPLDKLLALMAKLRTVQPARHMKVYRGMGFNLNYQEKMGLFEQRFFMNFLIKGAKKGYKFRYSTPRPLSFSDDLGTAEAFGNTVVSCELTPKNNFIWFNEALGEAANRFMSVSFFHEVVLLDVGREIDYVIHST